MGLRPKGPTLGRPAPVGRSRRGRGAASCSCSRRPGRPRPRHGHSRSRFLAHPPVTLTTSGRADGVTRTQNARQPEPSNVPHRCLDGGYGAQPPDRRGGHGRSRERGGAAPPPGGRRTQPPPTPPGPTAADRARARACQRAPRPALAAPPAEPPLRTPRAGTARLRPRDFQLTLTWLLSPPVGATTSGLPTAPTPPACSARQKRSPSWKAA